MHGLLYESVKFLNVAVRKNQKCCGFHILLGVRPTYCSHIFLTDNYGHPY